MVEEPEAKYAMAFIDGQNLFRHAMTTFGHYHPNYDPIKLHKAVCAANGWTPNLVRFYTGTPSHQANEMWHGYWANRVLAMKRSGIHVTTRQIKYSDETVINDGKEITASVPREKGIDVRLALDVVSLARKKQFNVAVIYSQDQDLAEIVSEVKEIAKEQNRWVKVACAFPFGPNSSYRRGIDGTDWFKMDREFYDACLDERDYRLS